MRLTNTSLIKAYSIKEKNNTPLANIIEKYHESHTEEELIQIQKENRLIWETYYVPCNAFTQVKSIINSHK